MSPELEEAKAWVEAGRTGDDGTLAALVPVAEAAEKALAEMQDTTGPWVPAKQFLALEAALAAAEAEIERLGELANDGAEFHRDAMNLVKERDAALAKLAAAEDAYKGRTEECLTAERQRDAALARVAELEVALRELISKAEERHALGAAVAHARRVLEDKQ